MNTNAAAPVAERPPLNAAQAEPVIDALAKAYAIAMLLSVAGEGVGIGHAADAAMAMLDCLDAARAELASLTGAAA